LRQGRGNTERDGKEISVAVAKTDELHADGQPIGMPSIGERGRPSRQRRVACAAAS
jgi:hypothetical protein